MDRNWQGSGIAGIAPDELGRRCELAIAQGLQLRQWMDTLDERVTPFALAVDRGAYGHRAEGFFGEVEIDGRRRSLMGCRQHLSVGGDAVPHTVQDLRDLAFADLFGRASWGRADGRRGGFGVRGLIAAGTGPDPALRIVDQIHDWRRLGTNSAWAAISLELHDFRLKFGRRGFRVRQIVYVVQDPRFVRETARPDRDVLHRITLGYPFVPFAPLRNLFGYGPGKFGAALKQFSFSLTVDRRLDVEMIFAAAPRCEKMLNLGGFDPVYATLNAVEKLTFGALDAQPLRDRLETAMLLTHCAVHADFVEGLVTQRILGRQQHIGRQWPR
ncbi:MAG: hypothetical protein JWO81_1728 [Alphaproteobacteria bacterium]|nr:hypothetical protein [Alphaproteobacteria bacterium]